MKNFNIFGIRLKIWFLGSGSQKTNIERRELTKKGVLGQFADLRGRPGKKGQVVFLKDLSEIKMNGTTIFLENVNFVLHFFYN